MERGLEGFSGDAASAPGRFNEFSHRGARVFADYGHNSDAIAALVTAVEAMPAKRRTLVISAAGDRSDHEIREQARIAGRCFDTVILYQDAAQRGRADGEVLALLREGLRGAPRTELVEEVRGEFLAIDRALSSIGAEEICLILVDQVEEALAHIAGRVTA
ncbi:MAG: glutamate ligase domain-containing protein, partial [bacterium]